MKTAGQHEAKGPAIWRLKERFGEGVTDYRRQKLQPRDRPKNGVGRRGSRTLRLWLVCGIDHNVFLCCQNVQSGHVDSA